MNMESKQPQIGLMPEWRNKEIRLIEVNEAIRRCAESGIFVPKYWVDEKGRLSQWLQAYYTGEHKYKRFLSIKEIVDCIIGVTTEGYGIIDTNRLKELFK